MRYILSEQYGLRGWQKLPYGVMDLESREVRFVPKDVFFFLLKCDGRTELEEVQEEAVKKFEEDALANGVIRPAKRLDYLNEEQLYYIYPCRYKRLVQWSVTGFCNMKCRHCFMSAPNRKHGNPSHEELMNIVDQLSECGIAEVGITGGEPLIRPDFWQIVDALKEKKIHIDVIYTNGLLVNDRFIEEYQKRNLRAGVQMSFDGFGMHDWLRGVEGAEEAVKRAFALLQKNHIRTSAAMCLHRKNAHTIRETVRWLAEHGVLSLKINRIQEVGAWAESEVDIRLTAEETVHAYADYIPQFFEDNAPLSLILDGDFSFEKETETAHISFLRPCPKEEEGFRLSCPSLAKSFYIGAEGMVCPCMMMADLPFSDTFPNLHVTPLKEILGESTLMKLTQVKIKEVRDGNEECRKCEHLDKCSGGCRQAALAQTGSYYGAEHSACEFFRNGWDQLIQQAMEQPYQDYLKRNNIRPGVRKSEEDADPVC